MGLNPHHCSFRALLRLTLTLLQSPLSNFVIDGEGTNWVKHRFISMVFEDHSVGSDWDIHIGSSIHFCFSGSRSGHSGLCNVAISSQSLPPGIPRHSQAGWDIKSLFGCFRSTQVCPLGWTCLEYLHMEEYRGHPYLMSEPPKQYLFI